MSPTTSSDPIAVVNRLHHALNAHDLDAFVAGFAADYDSQQPAHPDRAFRGSEQVRKNWSTVFSDIPDFQSELVRVAASGDEVWSEWHWHGQPADAGRFEWRGVIIFGVAGGKISWARLYMGPVEAGAGIDAAVRSMGHGTESA